MSFKPDPKVGGVAVSAPGKVLLAGGFLVLDRSHTALVFGLDARFHVHIQRSNASGSNNTVVRSPQFKNAEWCYHEQAGDTHGLDGGVLLIQE